MRQPPIRRRRGAMLAACAGVFLAPLLAPGTAAAREWIVTVGASLGASPPYEGAGYDLFLPSATFNVRPADRPYRFTPPDGGSTLALIATRFIDFGPMLRLRYERSDTGRLQGLDKVDIAAEPGVFLNVWPTNWLRARVEARYGLNAYEGPVGDAALDIIHTGRRWDFSLGPRYGYGGTRYMDTYFGVTPEEAEHSVLIRGPYEPGAGSRYTGLEVAASYHITNRLRTTYGFGWHRLSNLAADSPVVKVAGSPNDYQGTFGVSYSFGVNIGKKREAP